MEGSRWGPGTCWENQVRTEPDWAWVRRLGPRADSSLHRGVAWSENISVTSWGLGTAVLQIHPLLEISPLSGLAPHRWKCRVISISCVKHMPSKLFILKQLPIDTFVWLLISVINWCCSIEVWILVSKWFDLHFPCIKPIEIVLLQWRWDWEGVLGSAPTFVSEAPPRYPNVLKIITWKPQTEGFPESATSLYNLPFVIICAAVFLHGCEWID